MQKRTTTPREERRNGRRPNPTKSWRGKSYEGSAKSAKDVGAAPEGSSGWATIEGAARLPYLLDTGATNSILPEKAFKRLREDTQVELETLTTPIQIIQVDGSTVQVDRIVHADITLETAAGPYNLG